MRVFLSYRRDDTAGRTGRLFDGLVSRLGARNVFQDVGSIEPGVDFEDAVHTAIARSDATLVMIGPDWATIRRPTGDRRLDDPHDHVRREVAAALAAGGNVVPVLVGDAQLPTVDELPEDLQPLAQRQAVVLRDATWHQDLDELIGRLKGEMASGPTLGRRRLTVATAVFSAMALAGIVWLLVRDDGESSSDDFSHAACPVPDASWASLVVSPAAIVSYELEDAERHRHSYTVLDAAARANTSGWEVVLVVDHANDTTPIDDTSADDTYYSWSSMSTLFVDDLSQGEPTCFSIQNGEQEVLPGKRAIARFGFQSSIDPNGVELEAITDDDRSISITG
jgi:TIR domain